MLRMSCRRPIPSSSPYPINTISDQRDQFLHPQQANACCEKQRTPEQAHDDSQHEGDSTEWDKEEKDFLVTMSQTSPASTNIGPPQIETAARMVHAQGTFFSWSRHRDPQF